MTELITRSELEASIKAGEVTVIDALGGAYYEQQHLPGAVALVADEVASRASEILPDRHAAIVTYCSNESCPNSGKVADLLTRAGYTNVRKYREGIQDWVGAGLDVESSSPASRNG